LEWTTTRDRIGQSRESLVDIPKLCAESRETLSHVGRLDLGEHAVDDRHHDRERRTSPPSARSTASSTASARTQRLLPHTAGAALVVRRAAVERDAFVGAVVARQDPQRAATDVAASEAW